MIKFNKVCYHFFKLLNGVIIVMGYFFTFHNAEKRFRDSIVMGRIWIGKDCITPHSRRYIRKAYVEYCTPDHCEI